MTFDVSITIPVWLVVLVAWGAIGFTLPFLLNWNVGVMGQRKQYGRYVAAVLACGPVAWAIVGWDQFAEFKARRRRRKRAATPQRGSEE